MNGAKTSSEVSTGLSRVRERARREPHGKMLSLSHHIDEAALARAYHRLHKNGAVGVDGITVEEYGQELERRLADLHERLKGMKYRHQPIRRVHIPKDNGKTRPIGVSATEDKIVQGALRELLEAIYEEDFLDCSYGFRPGRSAHDALKALGDSVWHGEASYILEADIESFFDSVDRPALRGMLEERIDDKSFLRLIGKCLHVGVLDGAEFHTPSEGTVQGSILSPLLGNIYLHHVVDLWYERDVKPRMKGRTCLVRYADDLLFGFERRDDAERVRSVLGQRLGRYGLRLAVDKTRLLDFRRPPQDQQSGKGPSTFDLLGFTHFWKRSRTGTWRLARKTRKKSLHKAIIALQNWCRDHRHLPIPEQHTALARRIRGHFNYFGINDNQKSLSMVLRKVNRAWIHWLRRRSQRTRMTWARFNRMLRQLPLPKVKVYKNLWATP